MGYAMSLGAPTSGITLNVTSNILTVATYSDLYALTPNDGTVAVVLYDHSLWIYSTAAAAWLSVEMNSNIDGGNPTSTYGGNVVINGGSP